MHFFCLTQTNPLLHLFTKSEESLCPFYFEGNFSNSVFRKKKKMSPPWISSFWNKGNNGDCSLPPRTWIVNGKLTTRLYDKRDDFNFPIVNFPFLSSNIPSAPAYGVYVSQLIRYARPVQITRTSWSSGSAHYKVVEPGVSEQPNW